MKLKYFIIILFFYQANFSQNKINGRITYLAKTDLSGLVKLIEKKPEFHKQINRELNNTKDVVYVLKFSKNKSIFSKLKKIKNEGARKKYNITEIKAGKGKYYTNTKENIILHQKVAFGENFLISYPLVKWELVNETKKIGKYKCYKAIGYKKIEGRSGIINVKLEAWYTLDLPLNFGPKEFSGLPGLVISLKEGQLEFNVIKIELNLNNDLDIIKPKKGKIMSLIDYNKMVKELFVSSRK